MAAVLPVAVETQQRRKYSLQQKKERKETKALSSL
jgi:hypothetical protein